MSDADNNTLLTNIYREVGETKVSVKALDGKVDSHIKISREEFKAINQLDAEQNSILAAHIEGVRTLREMYSAHRSESLENIAMLRQSLELQRNEAHARIDNLERPYELVKYAGKALVWIMGVSLAALVGAWIKGWI